MALWADVAESDMYIVGKGSYSLSGSELLTLKKEMPWGKGDPINGEPVYYSFAGDTGINTAYSTSLGYDPHVDNTTNVGLQLSLANATHRTNNRHTLKCDDVTQAEFVSGVLTTEDMHEAQAGTWVIRAKMPLGKGLWGGIWLQGRDATRVDEGTPPEYDFEFDGNRPTEVYINVHHPSPDNGATYSYPWNTNDSVPTPGGTRPGGYAWYTLPGGATIDSFNDYKFVIDEIAQTVSFYVNDVLLDTAQQALANTEASRMLFVTLNLTMSDVGGNCGETLGFISEYDSGTTPLPAEFQIESVDFTRADSQYLHRYAYNDAELTGRNNFLYSGQSRKAQLSMGPFATSDAFTTLNPDYTAVAWVDATTRNEASWPWAITWNQIFCAEPWGINHLPGWINNTRVMMWDVQCWIKSKATGEWSLVIGPVNVYEDEFWDTTFQVYGGNNTGRRIETETGYTSLKPLYATTGIATGEEGYWVPHGTPNPRQAIDPFDVQDVIVTQKASLVIDDPYFADDRDFTRYLVCLGVDWYPSTQSLHTYPGAGSSRSKLVTAKWPEWQYHVMHTMEEGEFNYPSAFVGLAEGITETPVEPPPTASPSEGTWFPILTGGDPTWGTGEVPNTPPTAIRRRRRGRLY